MTVAEDFSVTQYVSVTPGTVSADESAQPVTYSISPTGVDFASVSINGSTGQVSISSVANLHGSQTFTVTAKDGQSAHNTASQAFTLTVTAVNDVPVTTGASLTAIGLQSHAFDLSASDVDSNTLTYQVVSQPTSGVLSAFDGASITYTPNRGTVGQDQFTFKVNDESGAESNPATVLLEVNAPAPLWEIVFQATVNQGAIAPQEVWIGVYQDSTDSYDSMFDIIAPPDLQPPILLNFYCSESRHTALTSKL